VHQPAIRNAFPPPRKGKAKSSFYLLRLRFPEAGGKIIYKEDVNIVGTSIEIVSNRVTEPNLPHHFRMNSGVLGSALEGKDWKEEVVNVSVTEMNDPIRAKATPLTY